MSIKKYFILILSLTLGLLSEPILSKTQFDSSQAEMAKEQASTELYETYRIYYLRIFEQDLKQLQSKLKSQLKFAQDLKNHVDSAPVESRRQFSAIFKSYSKQSKEFEKSLKRKEKFYEQDYLKPQSKAFSNDLKELAKKYRKLPAQWKKSN